MKRVFSTLTPWVTTLVSLASCGHEPAVEYVRTPHDLDASTHDAGPGEPALSATQCTGRALLVSRVHAWPGDGVALALSRRDDTGVPLPADADASSPALVVEHIDGSELAYATHAVGHTAGITGLVLIAQNDGAANAAVVEAASELIAGLPQDESFVLWSGEAGLPLFADATSDREHLARRLAAWSASEPRSLSEGELTRLTSSLARLDNPFRAPQRNLVLIGSELGAPTSVDDFGDAGAIADSGASHATPVREEPVTVLRLHAATEDEGALVPARDASSWGGSTSAAHAGGALAEHILSLRASQVRIGVCAAHGELRVRMGAHECTLTVPDDVVRAHGECVAEDAARDVYPLGEVVDFHFTQDERALHDDYDAKNSDLEFTAHVSFGAGPKLPARAHFRGQTSLACDRKNYSVNLLGEAPRRLFEGGGDDELYLISMCKERFYYRQVLANRILNDLGVFPLEQRYVEVRVDGESQGPYLLLRKPTEHARAMGVATEVVIRRRLDADDKPAEVRYPKDVRLAEAALVEYAGLAQLAASTAPGELYEALRERMDIDGYLRWMAFHTYMQNGDYVDEIFFQASRERREVDGAVDDALYFRPIAWDSDDLFKSCHHGGRFAHVDPRGILYCAEGDLDLGLLRDPDLYARFVEELERLMTSWAPERVEEELVLVRDALFSIMDEPRVCARAVELISAVPDASECEAAQRAIVASMDELVAHLADRRSLLEAQIQSYKGAP